MGCSFLSAGKTLLVDIDIKWCIIHTHSLKSKEPNEKKTTNVAVTVEQDSH